MIGVAYFRLKDSHGLPISCNIYENQHEEYSFKWLGKGGFLGIRPLYMGSERFKFEKNRLNSLKT